MPAEQKSRVRVKRKIPVVFGGACRNRIEYQDLIVEIKESELLPGEQIIEVVQNSEENS